MIPMEITEIAAAIGADDRAGDLRPVHGDRRLSISRVTTDSRDVRGGDLFFAIPGPRFDGHDFIAEALNKGAAACVCSREWWDSPGRSVDRTTASARCLPVVDTVEALGRLAGYYRRRVMNPNTTVIAVTGSNGKTTTKSMIHHVLAADLPGRASLRSFNNQIGVPLTILSAESDDRYLVVEIGTNAPGEIAALGSIVRPRVAVITSIGEAHTEGLGDINGVAAEKASLLRCLHSTAEALGLAIVNIDRPQIRPYLSDVSAALSCVLLTVGIDASASLRVSDVVCEVERTAFTLDGRFRVELSMPGLHHATNAAAAFAVARWLGLPPVRSIERLATFQPSDGRTRTFEVAGISIVDDAYNANPASVAAAIETLRAAGRHRRRIFVLGDMLELGDDAEAYHGAAIRSAIAAGVDVVVAVGPLCTAATRPCPRQPDAATVVSCPDAAAVAPELIPRLRRGDIVWIKASRRTGLDRVVRDLQAALAHGAAVA